jgi:hypothetical protein
MTRSRSQTSDFVSVEGKTISSGHVLMPVFPSKPLNTSNTFRKHPTWFGIPFVLIIVAASFGLQQLTQTRYDLQAQKVSEVKSLMISEHSLPVPMFSMFSGLPGRSVEAEEKSEDTRYPRRIHRAFD